MAAGVGERLTPLTDKIPKPLLRVNGIPIIETMIQGFLHNGICEIYIVVGHLKEQFEYLLTKYESVQLLENPNYAAHNNISSLYVARDFLECAVICDGDQILHNPDILNPFFEYSEYASLWTDEVHGEWLQHVDDNGYVINCSREGGKSGWQLFSVSFWTEADGARLKRHLEELYPRHNQCYWDDIPMFIKNREYRLKIRPIQHGDITEIDTLQEYEIAANKYGEE